MVELYVIVPIGQLCKILDPEIIYNVTCKSKNLNRTMNLGSRIINYRPGISITNLHVNLRVYRKFATIYRQFMININIDVCALNSGFVSSVTKILNIERRRKNGNWYDPCPISGMRYEKDVIFDYSSMPEIIPAGEYRTDSLHFTEINGEKREILLIQNFGEVKTTTAEQWKK
ncbi:hypothetical protein HA402_010589 [Bradysia odoriphaga]|nr:hypothetical protein HA402_010589 [Bradysia odoriphaga]